MRVRQERRREERIENNKRMEGNNGNVRERGKDRGVGIGQKGEGR